MQAKVFEVFDRVDWFMVLAVKYTGSDEREQWILNNAALGSGSGYSLQLTDLSTGQTHRDAYRWQNGRTYVELHRYLQTHFDNLESGGVLDVEFITGETDLPKTSRLPIGMH